VYEVAGTVMAIGPPVLFMRFVWKSDDVDGLSHERVNTGL
jgi:hypothetical protein